MFQKRCNMKRKLKSEKNNPKEIWKLINSVIPNKRSSNPPLTKLIVDNKVYKDPIAITKKFNNYFVKIQQTISNLISNTPDFEFKSYLKNPIPKTIVLNPPEPIEIFNITKILTMHVAMMIFPLFSLPSRRKKEEISS